MSTLKWLMLRRLSAVNCLFFLDYVNEASLERWFVYMQWVRRRWFYFYWRNAVAKDRKWLKFQPTFCRLLLLTLPLASAICHMLNYQMVESQTKPVSVLVAVQCSVRWCESSDGYFKTSHCEMWKWSPHPAPAPTMNTMYLVQFHWVRFLCKIRLVLRWAGDGDHWTKALSYCSPISDSPVHYLLSII